MNIRKFPLYIPLHTVLVLSSLVLSSGANAMSDVSLSGEFNLLGSLKQLPTRDQGVSSFSLPSVRLDIEVPLRDSNDIFIELESSEFRDATSKRYDTQLKEAYVNLRSLIPSMEIQYGLVPNSWVQYQREGWDYDFWGPSSEVFLIRHKYSEWADLGAVLYGQLVNEWGEWTLSAVNGEGGATEELGKYKEFQAVFSWQGWAPFYLTLGYLHGNYDVVDEQINQKTRVMVDLAYASELTYVSLSYYGMKDPADMITAGQMAGGVGIVPLAGTSVEGQGWSLLARRKITARTDVFIRGDHLQPVKSDSAKVLKAAALGAAFQSNEDMLWVFGFESTVFNESYAPGIRDQSQFLVATQVRF